MPRIQINEERFDDLLGDEFFGFFEGNPIWLFRALSHFVTNGDGQYMEQDEAFKWLKSTYTLREIRQIRSEFLTKLQEKAVPLASEKPSETPSSQEPK